MKPNPTMSGCFKSLAILMWGLDLLYVCGMALFVLMEGTRFNVLEAMLPCLVAVGALFVYSWGCVFD